jgi:hypothetical protein
MGRQDKEGEIPVCEIYYGIVDTVPEYGEARETLSESRETTL